MALVRMGGYAAETLTLLLGGGALGPSGGVNFTALLYTTEAGSTHVPTLNAGGTPITVTSDAGGGVGAWYFDDTLTRQVWVDRGALPRLLLFGPVVTGIVTPDGTLSGDVTLDSAAITDLATLLSGKVDTGSLTGQTSATPDTIMSRDANGRAFVADPVSGQQAMNFQTAAAQIAAVTAVTADCFVATDYAIPLSSSTAVLVPGLSISAVSGDIWHISGLLLYTATTVAKLAFTLKIPGGTSKATGRATGLVGGVSKTIPIYWGNTLGNHLSDTFDGLGLLQANICAVVFDARITINTTGTIEIRVAQNTPEATQGYVFAGSYMLGANAP